MLRFLGFRRLRLSLNLCLFAVFGVVAMALAAPRVAEGFREQAPPLPTLRPIVGPVTRIVDGDTFWIGRNKIRLWGIDAPELSTANGPTATRYLAMVVGNYPLTCRQAGAPSYDRLVARCLDPWGRDVAEIMVGAGWAVDWPKFSKGRYRPAEDRAAALRAGIHGLALNAGGTQHKFLETAVATPPTLGVGDSFSSTGLCRTCPAKD